MVHGPATEWKKEKCEGYKTKLGLFMFIIYITFYFAFVFLCVLNPKLVSMKVGSLNLAVTFGFFLIIIAIIQAVIYNILCSKREQLEEQDNDTGGKITK